MSDSQIAKSNVIVELSVAAGGLAHEIRNALSTLRMNLQMLDEDWGEMEARDLVSPIASETLDVTRRSRKRVATLLKETRRLESILEDFLHFVRGQQLKPVAADLNQVVVEVVEFFRPQAEASEIALDFAPAPAAMPARVDVNLLKQAILNLLINAQQATRPGGRLSVRVGRTEGGAAQLDIEDSGAGIAPEHMARLFEAYFSTKKGGTGLGLTLARQIIREHGGELSACSPPGRGACFSIVMPMSAAGDLGHSDPQV
ncbi:MAG TPA: ATP-binding protein [Phycisphaerae bacterium]|nr:ATP-binding protein [Phycisphaerae bacterium]